MFALAHRADAQVFELKRSRMVQKLEETRRLILILEFATHTLHDANLLCEKRRMYKQRTYPQQSVGVGVRLLRLCRNS